MQPGLGGSCWLGRLWSLDMRLHCQGQGVLIVCAMPRHD